ncbi:Fut1_Fut2_like domain containing protein [Methylophilaceae bacterium]
MNKVTVRLAGGLGNQLFQLFAAIYCMKNNLKNQIILDIRFLEEYEIPRHLEIDFILDVMQCYNITKNPKSFTGFLSFLRIARLIDRCVLGFALLSSSNKVKKTEFQYYANTILDGYFQDPELISREEVDSIFKLLVERYYKSSIFYLSKEKYVAIHIRRGDYINSKAANTFNIIPLSFYKRAVERFPLDTKFLVFGDDSRVNHDFSVDINGLNVSTLNLNLSEEFMLLAMADHYVIANSTFSWWASYLGYNESKRVIAPRDWYMDKDRSLKNPLLMKYFEFLD